MTDDKGEIGTFDYLRQSPQEELTSRLNFGEFLTPEEIAAFIRGNSPKDWPLELSEHVAGLLDGSAMRPRGRPRNKHQVAEDVRIQVHYSSALKVLQGKTEDIPSEFVELVLKMKGDLEPSMARHEMAKAITSELVFGSPGHVKKVQERYRSQKT